ncbi:MAG: fumarate hydratase, partial [Rhodospirillales bacterium]|nr:fumarate hydratase [Rhodospirillales bacterium]
MSEYQHHEMFPLGEDTTSYRKLTSDGVSTANFDGQEVLKIDPSALAMLAEVAMR